MGALGSVPTAAILTLDRSGKRRVASRTRTTSACARPRGLLASSQHGRHHHLHFTPPRMPRWNPARTRIQLKLAIQRTRMLEEKKVCVPAPLLR